MQFLANIAIFSVITYVPLWGRQIGLNDSEIALIATIYGIIAFASGIIIGKLSDLYSARKIFIIAGLGVGSIALIGMIIPDKLGFIIFRAFSGIGLGMFAPALIALVSDKGNKLGNFSSRGALGWSVGILTSGIIGLFWVPAIFLYSALSLLGALVVAFTLTEDKTTKKYKDPLLLVFWERKKVYIAFGLRHSFAAALWTLWALFLSELGADTFWIAVISFVNAFTQTILMRRVTDRLNCQKMVAGGLLLTSICFILYTIPSSFIGIIPLQVILGTSFALLYVGTLRYSVEKSSFDKSTAAGLLQSTQNFSFIIGAIIALIITSLGGSYLEIIWTAAIANFITFAGFLFFLKK
ncbi:MAG: MFS transporter [Promethearchaeota archaeon]